MKKLITFVSLCLAVVMTLPLVASCAAGDLPFTDVKAGKWYYGNVKYVFENAIMNGVTDTKFDPNGTLTRGMCATIIYRMAGSPKTEAENKFTDVKAGKYYTKAVIWAQSKGIVNGRAETKFAPDASITRAEFATILYRYADTFRFYLQWKTDGYPTDYDKIPDFAEDAVNALFRSGVINGREGGRFQAMAKITRAEAAAMLDRFIKTAEERSITGDDDILGIAFIGNSFMFVPKTYDHFKAIAGDKHKVQIYNRTHGGWMLSDHYAKWSQRSASTIAELTKDWDVVVMIDGGAAEELLTEERAMSYYEEVGAEFGSFEEFYDELESSGAFVSTRCYKGLVSLFGDDKLYFNLCGSSIMKKEQGTELRVIETAEEGMRWHVVRNDQTSSDYQTWVYSNKASFMWRDWLKQNCNTNRIMLNLDSFDPDHLLNPRDFDYMPDDYHPKPLYGYCHALALYCTIYDEPCIEQNNGILTDDDIPGDTPEEKAAYMVMIKNLVQEQLDFQNAH